MKNNILKPLTTAVILAAGKGSRLKTLSRDRSKAMMPITGKPIIERVMIPMYMNGIDKFVIVINPDDQHLKIYFENETNLDVNIKFVFQDKPKGTVDALKSAVPFIHDDFLLTSCDNLVSASHIKELINTWYSHPDLVGLLSLMRVEKEKTSSTGIIVMEGLWITRIIEKPSQEEALTNISSLPLYCFSPLIFDYIPKVSLSIRGEYELQDAIQQSINHHGNVQGVFTEHRLTLTNPSDLLEINHWYLNQLNDQADDNSQQVIQDSVIIPPVYLEDGSSFGHKCTIGPNVYTENGCVIGDRVSISNTVVLCGAHIASGEHIMNQVVAPHVRIKSEIRLTELESY